MIEQDTDPAKDYTADRPSARTPAEREAHFRQWWEQFGSAYEAAVVAAGGQSWASSIEERRELWMRRYVRPEAPAL